ncbi:monocarboxylate transporter 7 [Strongylocentrotus purpuratus]|uniref:Major facilitator superfamily (MFS) profile domain-containing protein n=1 Tax=Strongylocentrotus purpuratus TaxID=7668 RepID=A0A7M7RCC9_STRPU|nr:monocarboxylate transporter 7 [Strongylocentrotus purpuratus]
MDEKKKSKSKRRWFILLGAHISMLVYGATYRSFGVFLVEWRRYFDSSVAEISIIMSVLSGSVILSGFCSGPFMKRWGCHNTLLIGVACSITGTITSVFADSPIVLCFTSGILPGFGVGLIKNAAQVLVAFHFKKGYSRANGFISAGVALGIMTVPPLLQLCIDVYGWRGALLISAGIQAQVIPSALVARPRPKKKPVLSTKTRHEKLVADIEDGAAEMELLDKTLEIKNQSSHADENEESESTGCVQNDKTVVEASEEIQSDPDENRLQIENKVTTDDARTHEDCAAEVHTTSSGTDSKSVPSILEPKSKPVPLDDTLNGDINSMEVHTDETTIQNNRTSKCSWIIQFFMSSGWPLFRESIGFTLFQTCQITIGLCYTAIMTHFVASAVYSGIDEQLASFLLSALGIGSLIARLSNGWVIDLKLIAPEHLYALAMAILGVSTILSRASQAYGWYVFIAFLFGASSGLLKCLVPVVLRKFVGVENLAPAMGIFTIFTGVGDFIGPIFAGALYDAKESYNLPFFVAGSLLAVSSCILLLERPLRRCKDRYQGLKSHEIEAQNESVV